MVAAPPTGHSPAEPAGLTCRRRCDRRGGLRPPAAPAFRYRPRSRAGIQSPGVTRLTGPENGRRRWAVVECIVKVNLRLESAQQWARKCPRSRERFGLRVGPWPCGAGSGFEAAEHGQDLVAGAGATSTWRPCRRAASRRVRTGWGRTSRSSCASVCLRSRGRGQRRRTAPAL